jgi:hypothetical protein
MNMFRAAVRSSAWVGGGDVATRKPILRCGRSLLLQFNIERVAFNFAHNFHRVRLGIAPDHVTRSISNRLRFSIRKLSVLVVSG